MVAYKLEMREMQQYLVIRIKKKFKKNYENIYDQLYIKKNGTGLD